MVTCPQGNWNRTSLEPHVQVRKSSHSMGIRQGFSRSQGAAGWSSHDSCGQWDFIQQNLATYKTKNDVIGGWMEI